MLLLSPRATARADALRARLIAPTTQDELLVEALAMVKGELSAAGFRVTVQRAAHGAEAKASIDPIAAQDAATAVVVVQRQPSDSTEVKALEFWVYEPWGRETAVVRSQVDANQPSLSARRGAVQAVELLRAVLAQRGIAPKARAETQPRRQVDTSPDPTGPDPAHRDGPERSASVRVGTGLALWSGFNGLGSSLTPIAALSVALPSLLPSRDLALELRASAAGLGWASELALAEGTVQVRQTLMIGELVLRLWPRATVQPLLSLGGGAYAVSLEAEAVAPFVARSPHTWSGLLGGGCGVMLAASAHFAASLEAQLLSATAPSEVRVAGRVEAVAGAPMLLIGAQLMGGF